jgi:hypothetical protein
MFLKLFAIILAFGVIGCMLLVNRQQQIEAAHEMSLMHRHLSEQERVIWELRAQISQRISPEKLQKAREQLLSEWQPIVLHQWPGSIATWAGAPEGGQGIWTTDEAERIEHDQRQLEEPGG